MGKAGERRSEAKPGKTRAGVFRTQEFSGRSLSRRRGGDMDPVAPQAFVTYYVTSSVARKTAFVI
jgi:hypothetical protein